MYFRNALGGLAVLIVLTTSIAVAQTPAPTPTPASRPALPQPQPQSAPTPSAPSIPAKSYVLMDFASGRMLAEKNGDQRLEPASLTKMMSSYVVFEEIAAGRLKRDDLVTISEKAWKTGGSKMFIEVGKQVAVEDLLRGMIIQSGNDATVALAEQVAGSEDVFAQMMNGTAKRLGMDNTHFVNADGLPAEEHYSSAHDMARLSRAMIAEHPDDYALYAEKTFEWNGITQHNRNSLLWRDDSVDGIKTGHTESAGYCLAASAERDGMRLIAVVMGTDSEKARADAAQALLNYGFRFFESHVLYQLDAELATPKVWKGAVESVALGVAEPVVVTVPRGRYSDLKASMDLPRQIIAPIQQGQQVGTLKVSLDGEQLVERPLLARQSVEEAGFFGRLNDSFWMWWRGD
ncbi:MAG: D-alanyl-D-alanine carboxypeptidase [Xanthomonadales bacterium]|nr:D-alanyl-D-alanine carboxypeptidase [Xanthomonadales bacterium]